MADTTTTTTTTSTTDGQLSNEQVEELNKIIAQSTDFKNAEDDPSYGSMYDIPFVEFAIKLPESSKDSDKAPINLVEGYDLAGGTLNADARSSTISSGSGDINITAKEDSLYGTYFRFPDLYGHLKSFECTETMRGVGSIGLMSGSIKIWHEEWDYILGDLITSVTDGTPIFCAYGFGWLRGKMSLMRYGMIDKVDRTITEDGVEITLSFKDVCNTLAQLSADGEVYKNTSKPVSDVNKMAGGNAIDPDVANKYSMKTPDEPNENVSQVKPNGVSPLNFIAGNEPGKFFMYDYHNGRYNLFEPEEYVNAMKNGETKLRRYTMSQRHKNIVKSFTPNNIDWMTLIYLSSGSVSVSTKTKDGETATKAAEPVVSDDSEAIIDPIFGEDIESTSSKLYQQIQKIPIEADIQVIGDVELMTGVEIQVVVENNRLLNVRGERDFTSGVYVIKEVTHTIGEGDYNTSAKLMSLPGLTGNFGNTSATNSASGGTAGVADNITSSVNSDGTEGKRNRND